MRMENIQIKETKNWRENCVAAVLQKKLLLYAEI